MKFTIKKELKNFSAAHRLIKGYEGPCKNLHGHNYALQVTLNSKQLNEFDFVMDFDDIKKHFDHWVQNHWDHSTLVCALDLSLIDFLEKEKQKYFVIPGNKNTTTECLANFLFHQFNEILKTLNDSRITLDNVWVFESHSASACYSNDHSEQQAEEIFFKRGALLSEHRPK